MGFKVKESTRKATKAATQKSQVSIGGMKAYRFGSDFP